MIWQNAWAFAGLAAVAIPVLIHLLSRRNARVERFPTLRFLPVSQSAPVRRTRITDPALMVVRVLIVAAAVRPALAQPLMQTADRRAAGDRRVVRAIVVDTSASTQRRAAGSVSVRDSARRIAASIAANAAASIVVETANPAGVLQGASSWLSGQSGRRELIVVSDFQTATLDSVDLRVVAPNIAIQLERIAFVSPAPVVAAVANAGGVALLTSPSSRGHADAALRAAAPAPFDARAVAVTIVYPDARERSNLLRDARPVTNPGIADAIVRMRRDHLLAAAIRTIDDVGASADARFVRVSQADRSGAVVFAAQAQSNGRESLVLFPSFGVPTLASAALISAAARAIAPAAPPGEVDPEFISDAVLQQLERPGETAAVSHADLDGASDGRWLWLVALLLLGAETLLRRRPGDAAGAEAANAR